MSARSRAVCVSLCLVALCIGFPTTPTAISSAAVLRKIFDFDGDGHSDVAHYHPGSTNWFIIRSSTGQGYSYPWGSQGAIPAPGDYDGDGKTDLAYYFPNTTVWSVVLSSTGQSWNYAWGSPHAVPVPGEYDGDGKTDLAYYYPQSSQWLVVKSSNGQSYSVNFGGGFSVKPVPADFDGDQKTDLAYYDPATTIWYVRSSLTGQTSTPAWGSPKAVPVPADYDGDGRADLAYYYPQESKWLIWTSAGPTLTFTLGRGFDSLPAPADYDGDGKADIAHFYPPTGLWEIRGSATGSVWPVYWGGPDYVAITSIGNLGPNGPPPAITVSPETVAVGATVTAAWQDILVPSGTDWIGLTRYGQPDEAYVTRWDTGGGASGSQVLAIPTSVPPGNYQLRLFSGASSARLALSNFLTITTAACNPGGFAYDLDRNGANDANLSVVSCSALPGQTCLRADSCLFTPSREIQIASTPFGCIVNDNSVQGRRITLIGDYDGDGLSETSVLFCKNQSGTQIPTIAIVSIGTGSLSGSAAAPPGRTGAFVDFPKDPSGKLHPFMAPEYLYTGPNWNWEFTCVFRPDLPASPECGSIGFAKAPVPSASLIINYAPYREVGGFLQDLDGDGWEDINLLWEWDTIAVSPRTLSVINQTEFDVAAAESAGKPYPYKYFHGGRQYGTHSAITSTTGTLRDVMVAGDQLSGFNFTNPMCNVSRFVGVLESVPGNPSTRRLKWSKYFGFHSTFFDNSGNVVRPPDVEDGCIHRFSDSRSRINGREVIVFNHFIQSAPVDTCIPEQRAGGSSWTTCVAKNVASTGTWAVQVLDDETGALIADNNRSYVWGWSDKIMPGGETVYFVEDLSDSNVFNLSDHTATPTLTARTLNGDGTWQIVGFLPIQGRPVLPTYAGSGPRGTGDYSAFIENRLMDVDCDGLPDIQINDFSGPWVGYDQSNHDWIVKTQSPVSCSS
jgi:hypothetical protein